MTEKDSGKSGTAPKKRPAAPRRTAGKGSPPSARDTLGALVPAAKDAKPREQTKAAKKPKAAKENRSEPLNFRVTPDFRRAFKRAAADQDCKKVELLERIFAVWTAHQGKLG